MISFIAKALGLDSLAAYLIVAALAAALAGGAYWYVDHKGYARAEAYYKSQIAELKAAAADARNKEVERQDAANNAAKAREALQERIEELQREADQDPDAGKPVLGAPSVRRINKIR
jgi:Flp pilus assembly protein TadB